MAKALGFRSGFEMDAAAQIRARGLDPAYETFKVKYEIPARNATYTADFRLPNGIIVETKGRFVTADRKKHDLIKQQRPDLDIRIVFQRPNSTISKKSATTYAKWCDDRGIRWAKVHTRENPIPPDWFNE